MAEQRCVCGHGEHAHEDYDGGTHECQLCACVQFRDAVVAERKDFAEWVNDALAVVTDQSLGHKITYFGEDWPRR